MHLLCGSLAGTSYLPFHWPAKHSSGGLHVLCLQNHSHSLSRSILWLAARYTAHCQPLKLDATYGVLPWPFGWICCPYTKMFPLFSWCWFIGCYYVYGVLLATCDSLYLTCALVHLRYIPQCWFNSKGERYEGRGRGREGGWKIERGKEWERQWREREKMRGRN